MAGLLDFTPSLSCGRDMESTNTWKQSAWFQFIFRNLKVVKYAKNKLLWENKCQPSCKFYIWFCKPGKSSRLFLTWLPVYVGGKQPFCWSERGLKSPMVRTISCSAWNEFNGPKVDIWLHWLQLGSIHACTFWILIIYYFTVVSWAAFLIYVLKRYLAKTNYCSHFIDRASKTCLKEPVKHNGKELCTTNLTLPH